MNAVAVKSWCLIALMVMTLVAPAWAGCCCTRAADTTDAAVCVDNTPVSPSCCCSNEAPGDEAPTPDRCDCSKACCSNARLLAPAPRVAIVLPAAMHAIEFIPGERSLTPRDVHLDLLRPPQA